MSEIQIRGNVIDRIHKTYLDAVLARNDVLATSLEEAQNRAERAESSLAAMRQRAEGAEATVAEAVECSRAQAKNFFEMKWRAERAEACLRSLDPFFEFSSIPSGAEGFVVQGDNPALVEAFVGAASILSSPPADASTMGGERERRLVEVLRKAEEALSAWEKYGLEPWVMKEMQEASEQARAALADMEQKPCPEK